MSDLFGISSSAVATYQRALGVVSNNIANAATEGYTRQDVQLQENASSSSGGSYLGSGVVFTAVRRQYDAFVDANLRNSSSDLQSQQPMVDYTNRVVDVMGSETSGLGGALDQFFSSARSLSVDPASTVLRSSFLGDADALASRFNQLSAQLDLVDKETREAVQAGVTQINALAGQLASVNQQLSRIREQAKQPPELLDQRDQLLLGLAKYTKINTSIADNGAVTVSLGASITKDVLVQGKTATLLAAENNTSSAEKLSLVLDPYGDRKTISSISGGQIAGLLTFREQVLSGSRDALDTLATTLAREVNAVHTQGVDADGQRGLALFAIDSQNPHASSGLSVAISDPLRVSTASAFRIIEDASNTGQEDASIQYQSPSYAGAAGLAQVFKNNDNLTAAVQFKVTGTPGEAAVTTIEAGMRDVTLYLDTLAAGQQLQVLTRDARHLLGQTLSNEQQNRLLSSSYGFESAAGYSDDYLASVQDPQNYRNTEVFYGARAQAQALQRFDSSGNAIAPQMASPVLQGGAISPVSATISAGAFSLNGASLGALPANAPASDIASWLNNAAAAGLRATAANTITVASTGLRLNQTLTLNGTTIGTGFNSAADLVSTINSQSATTHVVAQLGAQGELILNNASGHEGQNITIGSLGANTANALSLNNAVYGGQIRIERTDSQTEPIELAIAAGGDPAMLKSLGLRAQVHIAGEVPDDMLVFVTGAGAAALSASYSGQPNDDIDRLRQASMLLSFDDSATHFVLTDADTGTVLAERDYDPSSGGFSYQGLTISFSRPPMAGDTFEINGNDDGAGDNQNLLALVALESRALLGSKTLTQAYTDQVNTVGNIGSQASIVQSSLKVVHDQAISSRDQVSGVSLDEEATNLIRFQQAYQASAKSLQVASQLFDAILQVN